MCQSDVSVLLIIYSFSSQLIEANCQQEEMTSLCYPTGSINILLTQE